MAEIIPWGALVLAVAATVSACINLWFVRQNLRQFRQWVALNDMLLHLCVGAFALRHWPMVRHIIEITRDDEPEPPPRRFWQRRPPERTP